jgi:uncharacterized protein (DUF1501 family)
MLAGLGGAAPLTVSHLGDPRPAAELIGTHGGFAGRALDDVTVAISESIVPLTGWQRALAALQPTGTAVGVVPVVAGLSAVAQVEAARPTAATSADGYPATPLGDGLRDVVRLVRSNAGPRAVAVDDDGWDLHADHGGATSGRMVDKLSQFAHALAAFAEDLGPDLNRVTLVTVTEFGRRAAENGSGGTDHGHGSVMFALGGGVVGGRVHGSWPSLAASSLADGDLAVTTDFRQVLAEILTVRCGVGDATAVFPGLKPATVGVVGTD